VYDVASENDDALRAQLDESRERLEGLVRELRAIDAELEDLATERQQFELLHDVCAGLEKLDQLGAAQLFWSGRASGPEANEHLRRVQCQVDEFQRRLALTEGNREALREQIRCEQYNHEILEDDALEAQWQEEQRKLEWIVERDVGGVVERPSIMPWSHGGEDDQRFRRSLAASLLVGLLLGALLPMIDLPLPEQWERLEVPERLTRLIQERPLPPPPKIREEVKPKEQEPPPEEAPLLAEEGTPAPANDQPPQKSAASKGILAFREQFSALAEHDNVSQLGAEARINRAGEARSGRPQRALVTSQVGGSSAGVELASLSRDVGGGGNGQGLEGVAVARATSSIGTGGGSDRPLSGGPGSARTDEEIQIVFDRHKAALYRLYNRELRRDPTLQGQMVLRLTIEPDGSVSFCGLQSTDMKAPQLAAQVVERVKTFDFGAKDGVPALTIVYPIDFLPAT